MEIFFLAVLIFLMAMALGSGFPVAFALPGSAILTILLAGLSGLIFTGDAAAYFHAGGGPWQWLSAGVTNLRSVYWVPQRDTLIAVPLFIFMGIMLQKSKIAEDLLVTMAQLFGPVPGGLGISVVFVGALLAATTGIVGATVVAMGLISLPAMMRHKYSTSLATGTIAASGTLGQIIPPSIVLTILADQLSSATDQAGVLRKTLYKEATGEFSMPSIFDVGSTSAGEMFLGALVPGLVLVGIYMLYILTLALLRPHMAPAVNHEGRFDLAFWKKVALVLVPPLTLIFLVLGSIIMGVATVNQAGAIGAVGALVMAGYRLPESDARRYWPALLGLASVVLLAYVVNNFEMNVKLIRTSRDALGIGLGSIGSVGLIVSLLWSAARVLRIEDTLHGVMRDTAKTTALVFVILMGAAILTAAFRAFGGEFLVREFLNGLPGGFWTKFTVVMAVIFILGFFIDFIEISVVVVPIVAPILLADPSANVTAVWLGVMIGLNIQTSFLTPPFGFALFYLRGVVPASVKTIDIYKGVIPFILLQLIALAIVAVTPSLVNYLPNRVSYLSETSPPPRNPRLEVCVDKYISNALDEDGTDIRAAITRAREIDLAFLPRHIASNLTAAFDEAEQSFALAKAIDEAQGAVDEALPAYRPQRNRVRALEHDINSAKTQLKAATRNLQEATRSDDAAQKAAQERKIDRLNGEIASLKARIPQDWPDIYKSFHALTTAESTARTKFHRAADTAYQNAQDVLKILDATPDFIALAPELTALRDSIENDDGKTAEARIKAVTSKLNKISGASDVAKPLSKARRYMHKKPPRRDDALKKLDEALALYDKQKAWREEAEKDLRPELEAYLGAIRENIGMRVQHRMTRDQGLFVAACNAGHRDISPYF